MRLSYIKVVQKSLFHWDWDEFLRSSLQTDVWISMTSINPEGDNHLPIFALIYRSTLKWLSRASNPQPLTYSTPCRWPSPASWWGDVYSGKLSSVQNRFPFKVRLMGHCRGINCPFMDTGSRAIYTVDLARHSCDIRCDFMDEILIRHRQGSVVYLLREEAREPVVVSSNPCARKEHS